MKLENKVAVITGGASGLGEATVRRYISHGASVAIFDLNEDRAKKIIIELGNCVRFYKVDVSNEASVKEAVAAVIIDFGAIHTFVIIMRA